MDSNMENKGQQKAPDTPGTTETPVQEGLNLLKRLSEFNSKKEEVLKKLASISDRMEQRLKKSPLDAHLHDDILDEMPSTPEQPSNKPAKIIYTRTKETPKPVFLQGCFNICVPSKNAISDWESALKGTPNANFSIQEDCISLHPGSSIKIPTGVKLALPHGIVLQFMSIPGLCIEYPCLFTEHMREQELEIIVANKTLEDMKIFFGVPLFTAFPIQLTANINCEELLNSTYEDWAHGTITG